MKFFFFRLLLLGVPLYLLLIIYFICDPFRIIYQYDGLYKNNPVGVNREFASTELFLKKHTTLKYNSFIFGSSRSLVFYPDSLARYLGPNARPFVFDASGETIFGMNAKVKLIDRLGVKIENALVILDSDHTFRGTTPRTGNILNENHPIVKGSGGVGFQLNGIKSFINFPFLTSYFAFKFFDVKLPYAQNYIEERPLFVSDTTNMLFIPYREDEISSDTENYYRKREAIFKRHEISAKSALPTSIDGAGMLLLKEMKTIFDKHKTSYKLVISPLYSQKTLSKKAKEDLASIFGKENIYDFSGVNEITSNKYNYYEASHFRPHVADSIMRQIYR